MVNEVPHSLRASLFEGLFQGVARSLPEYEGDVSSIVLLLFLQKQNLANAIYLFGLGTLLCCLHS